MTSFYDQFSGGAEVVEPPQRVQNWQANREDTTKNYVNNDKRQERAAESSPMQAKDLSHYAFNRFALKHPPTSAFEISVNGVFNRVIDGKNWDEMKKKYTKLYRQMMND